MDSPKHIACLNNGFTGQYYRIARTQNFKCKSCGDIRHKDSFQEGDFLWRKNPKAYEVLIKNLLSDKGKKNLKKALEAVNK